MKFGLKTGRAGSLRYDRRLPACLDQILNIIRKWYDEEHIAL
jgi:hypothetical protein